MGSSDVETLVLETLLAPQARTPGAAMTPPELAAEAADVATEASPAAAIVAALGAWLQTPMGAAACRDIDGFVPVGDALSMCSGLRDLAGSSVALVVSAVQAAGQRCPIACDQAGRAVRLCGLIERLRLASERHLQETSARGVTAISLLDLLRSEHIGGLLQDVAEPTEQLQMLSDAIKSSAQVELDGSRVVVRQAWPAHAGCWPAETWQMVWPYAGSTDQGVPGGFAPNNLGHDASGQSGAVAGSQYVPVFVPYGPAPGEDWGSLASPWSSEGKRKGRRRPSVPLTPVPDGGLADGHKQWDRRGRSSAGEDRRDRIAAAVAEMLENIPPQVADHMESDGSVAASHILEASPWLANLVYKSPSIIVRSVVGSSSGRLAADSERMTVRLLSVEERLCQACETYVSQKLATDPLDAPPTTVAGSVPLAELLGHPPIKLLLASAAASSCEAAGGTEQTDRLKQALAASDILTATEGGVAMQPPDRLVLRAAEAVLDDDPKTRTTLSQEREVPLQWVVEQGLVRKTLERLKVSSARASLDAVRAAINTSCRYVLDDAGMSVRFRWPGAEKKEQLGEPETSAAVADRARTTEGRWRCIPLEKDVQLLRKLLSHYFQPFNLQHNRVLMAVVQAQAGRLLQGQQGGKVGYLLREGCRPFFNLEDLAALPRVARLFEQYDSECAPLVLAAAVQMDEALPVKISNKREVGGPRGAWAVSRPQLELRNVPDLRFVEAVDSSREEVKPLLSPGETCTNPMLALAPHVICVVSYSVSSDLSHSQSPKAEEALQAIAAGGMDPSMIQWDCRQQRIIRQLGLHGPDIMCIQGLQSISFTERCSEWDQTWFSCDDEPASNHLVHLYRELSKNNYGVAFAPTMKLPGSSVVCFGNAVFWKRSRWQLVNRRTIDCKAAVVELESRLNCPRLLVCSSKSAAAYAHEWSEGRPEEAVDDGDLVDSVRDVHASLLEASELSGAASLWCGDFGCDATALLPGLGSGLAAPPAEGPEGGPQGGRKGGQQGGPQDGPQGGRPAGWVNACGAVLGTSPWTTISKSGVASDLVLHDARLQTLAVLGGLRDCPSLVDFLADGHPSDHLLQMAMLVGSGR